VWLKRDEQAGSKTTKLSLQSLYVCRNGCVETSQFTPFGGLALLSVSVCSGVLEIRNFTFHQPTCLSKERLGILLPSLPSYFFWLTRMSRDVASNFAFFSLLYYLSCLDGVDDVC
jgi:hypothetical protein